MQNEQFVLYCYNCNLENSKEQDNCEICGTELLFNVKTEDDISNDPIKQKIPDKDINTDITLDEMIACILEEDEKNNEIEFKKKEKYIETQSLVANFLKYNAIHFPAFLSDTEQQLILEDCINKLSIKNMPGGSYDKISGPSHGFSYKTGWIADNTNEIVPCCIELAKNQHEKFIMENKDLINHINNNLADGRLGIPNDFDSGSLWARMYGPENGLGFHTDPPGCGWVLVISIGADIDFQYYLKNSNKPCDIRIKSGEAVMFNGEILHHGIKKVHENTPYWWDETIKNVEHPFTRIGLQMRIRHV
jgi:hypothetical protein